MTLAFRAPVTTSYVEIPLSLQPRDYLDALSDGAVAVDLRSASSRAADGVLVGALALASDTAAPDAAASGTAASGTAAPDTALDLLSPDSARRLRAASADSRWVIVSTDGYDAEMLAWHLQARGVHGARFVVGGYAALRAEGLTGAVDDDALGLYDAH
ncbi:hypothetical protein [Gordonia shandongensis]|uniref:hypothetical protein n=1 Tax=Gordonia shandongensis TaxID=376351 RepID=UPI0004279076|nr:hypothetical protein [Gordonia shandongensis]